jgi:hypothetical protein
MAITQKFIVIGLLFLATLATGFWRGNAGNPALSGLLHKLLALAWVIYTAIVVYHPARQIESRTAFFATIAVLAVSIVALFWSGSVLTMPKLESAAWLAVHRIASVFAVVAFAFALRLFILNGQ